MVHPKLWIVRFSDGRARLAVLSANLSRSHFESMRNLAWVSPVLVPYASGAEPTPYERGPNSAILRGMVASLLHGAPPHVRSLWLARCVERLDLRPLRGRAAFFSSLPSHELFGCGSEAAPPDRPDLLGVVNGILVRYGSQLDDDALAALERRGQELGELSRDARNAVAPLWAVRFAIGGVHIGYVADDEARVVGALLERGMRLEVLGVKVTKKRGRDLADREKRAKATIRLAVGFARRNAANPLRPPAATGTSDSGEAERFNDACWRLAHTLHHGGRPRSAAGAAIQSVLRANDAAATRLVSFAASTGNVNLTWSHGLALDLVGPHYRPVSPQSASFSAPEPMVQMLVSLRGVGAGAYFSSPALFAEWRDAAGLVEAAPSSSLAPALGGSHEKYILVETTKTGLELVLMGSHNFSFNAWGSRTSAPKSYELGVVLRSLGSAQVARTRRVLPVDVAASLPPGAEALRAAAAHFERQRRAVDAEVAVNGGVRVGGSNPTALAIAARRKDLDNDRRAKHASNVSLIEGGGSKVWLGVTIVGSERAAQENRAGALRAFFASEWRRQRAKHMGSEVANGGEVPKMFAELDRGKPGEEDAVRVVAEVEGGTVTVGYLAARGADSSETLDEASTATIAPLLDRGLVASLTNFRCEGSRSPDTAAPGPPGAPVVSAEQRLREHFARHTEPPDGLESSASLRWRVDVRLSCDAAAVVDGGRVHEVTVPTLTQQLEEREERAMEAAAAMAVVFGGGDSSRSLRNGLAVGEEERMVDEACRQSLMLHRSRPPIPPPGLDAVLQVCPQASPEQASFALGHAHANGDPAKAIGFLLSFGSLSDVDDMIAAEKASLELIAGHHFD